MEYYKKSIFANPFFEEGYTALGRLFIDSEI